MKISKKKIIYLISPNKLYKNFYKDLKVIFKTGKISFFQLRLKKYSQKNKISIGKKIKTLCKKNRVKFIVNDDPLLTLKLNADGCHLGQKDMDIKKAIKAGASYLAFGAFYSSKTKKIKYKASTKILNNVKKFTKTPIVAIGGINSDNYKNLLLNNANFLAISSYIWKNKKYKPLQAIESLK